MINEGIPFTKRRPSSIALLVIVSLVAVAFVLFGALGVIVYRNDREQGVQRLRDSVAAESDQLATALSLPIWNFDRAQINHVIDSIMKVEDIYGVVLKISDVHETVQIRARNSEWQPVALDKPFPVDGLLLETRAISSPDELLGHVYVYGTSKFVEARLYRGLITTIAIIATLGTILIVSLYGLLWRTTLKPLRELEQYATAASGTSRETPRFPNTEYYGELERLRCSLASMVSELQNRYTELQNVEIALRESEGLMKSLIQNLPIELWAKDAEGRYILQNAASISHWGNQLGKLISESEIPAELRPRWKNTNDAAMNGNVVRDEWRTKDLHGETRIFSEVVAPIYEGEKIRGILGVNIDITEQYNAAAARIASEERFQLVARGTNDGIWDWDLINNTAYRSSRLKELLGYVEEEFGDSIDFVKTLVHPEDKSRVEKIMYDHLSKRTVYDTELRIRHKNGEYRWFRARGQAVWNEAGTATRLAGSISDIHDKKLAEAELVKHQQQLQSLASRLVLLEESERRNFARLLHDHVGQNLTFAKIRLGSAIKGKTLEPELLEAIKDVQSVIEQMCEETRSLTYELSPPLLYEIGLDAALEWLGEQFEKRYGFVCKLQSSSAPETLYPDDRVVLFQSARELLFNIAKHAQAKTVTIISARENGCLQLTIKDDGLGFKPKPKGTTSGFGLFNVTERIRYIGGDIKIESSPGLGSSITLVLPLTRTANIEATSGAEI